MGWRDASCVIVRSRQRALLYPVEDLRQPMEFALLQVQDDDGVVGDVRPQVPNPGVI